MFKEHSTAIAMVAVLSFTPLAANSDVSDAKRILQNMSAYLTAEQNITFDFDATLEVVTTESQKLGIANSGTVTLARPDKIHIRRAGGFADIEIFYDGQTFTLAGNHAGIYTQIQLQGTVDTLIDELRDTYGRPLPAADLLIANPYDILMSEVTDVKDLGSGIISGRECDHLAFRTPDVDWQIWISQGEKPYPCRYVITTHSMDQGPQYQVDVRDWRAGEMVSDDTFVFNAASGASEVSLEDYKSDLGDLPDHFVTGETE